MDAMTDKKSCTALYQNDWKVQGASWNMFIGFRGRGGVSAYTLRFDEDPAEALQLATEREKSISAVILEPHFSRIYHGTRLRIQVMTVLKSVLVEDVNLKGFREATDYIRSSCEGTTPS